MNFFTPERLDKLRQLSHDGKPFVFDDGDMRTLHFNEHVVQSAMRISDPYELVISYTRAMTGFLLFQPVPAHIFMVGLGGGSLAKYCYRNMPSATITVIESDIDVIGLRSHFMLPADDARLRVVHADAVTCIEEQAEASVDVILLDGFDAGGAPATLYSIGFFAECWRILGAGGVLVANMADETDTIAGMVEAAQILFGIRAIRWLKTRMDNSHLLVAVKFDDPHVVPGDRDARLSALITEMCAEQALELVYPRSEPEAPEIGTQDCPA